MRTGVAPLATANRADESNRGDARLKAGDIERGRHGKCHRSATRPRAAA